MSTTVYVATETGDITNPEGGTWQIVAGKTRVRAGHPMIALAPALFRPAEDRVHYEWETADAPKRTRQRAVKPDEGAPKRDPRRSED